MGQWRLWISATIGCPKNDYASNNSRTRMRIPATWGIGVVKQLVKEDEERRENTPEWGAPGPLSFCVCASDTYWM
jgi:hypothetical protein